MTSRILNGRRTADTAGEVTVFLIGMRVNRFRAVRRWLPVFAAMPRMLRELRADPEAGLLDSRLVTSGPREFGVIQHWESTEKLLAYAAATDREHRPAWAAFNRRARDAKGAVGIWHETYVVPAGSHESIYVDMPPYGLAAAHGSAPVGRRNDRAGQRLTAAS
ncbi:DUF4188 domain-containing protein [Streptomyces sp. 891-h]|uniref:DUF4188 domain-containing protein n=1 Tax=unclassified Streptomyces TaxID=2593676 RepID=UPI001FAAB339|nr:DUF4188 domain-containing protein [Streptomyces sp. 891-h]UNZ17160.1 DUF4188 domain-containing protein [Streptomyces sp. 891-h]